MKDHCTADLLFILFGFSCNAYIQLAPALLFGRIHTSQTGGQPHSDTSPYAECSLPQIKQPFACCDPTIILPLSHKAELKSSQTDTTFILECALELS